jgi:hypothetical protein
MKSDILLTLIKEVVKSEVKQQVKEEISKMIKSGKLMLNNKGVQKTSPLSEIRTHRPMQQQPKVQIKEITKNPMINEILSQTTPFTSAHRAEGGPAMGATGGSILDALQPSVSMEGDWETMDYRGMGMPQQPMPMPETDNAGVDALTKALTRDYSELVKRFK